MVRYPGDPAAHLVFPPFDLAIVPTDENTQLAGLWAAIGQDRITEFAKNRYPLLDSPPAQSDALGYVVDRHGIFDTDRAFLEQRKNEIQGWIIHGSAFGNGDSFA
jgi:hypothetical protein